MCSPQKENGYTPIANEIMEVIAKTKLNGTQFRILMIIWRSTYGWDKKSHELSESFIAKATGINAKQIAREIRELFERSILIEISPPTFSKGREIAFNKVYTEWNEGAKTLTPLSKATTTGSELEGTTGSELVNQKNNIKNNIKNNSNYVSVFDHYMTLNLKRHRAYTKDMQKAIETAMKNNKYDEEYCKTLLDRHKQVVEATKNTDYPVKERGLAEFFGQKVYGAKHLICSEYEEGGKYYEGYIGKEQNDAGQVPVKKLKVDAS